MHTPDGFLTDPVCTVTALTATASLGYAFVRAREADNARSSAWMATTGAGIFAAQMVNFPVAQGTSGHVIGAALAAILLGPWRGMLTMAVVLAVQCLVFGDGGMSALGANVLNMGVVATLVAAGVYSLATRRPLGVGGTLLAGGAAAFASVLAAAVACSAELAVSGAYAPAEVFSAMLSVHLMIALCEALITVSVLAAVSAVAADRGRTSSRSVMLCGMALAMAVAGVLAPLASSSPDGLERVAEDLQFAGLASSSWSALGDYAAPGITWPALAVALAGVLGALTVFVSSYTVGRTAKARVRKQP